MGADGTIQYVSLEKWQENCPEVDCSDIGLYVKDVCGVLIVAGYWDTNDIDWREYGKQHLAAKEESCRHRIKLVDEEGENGVYKRKSSGGRYSPPDITIRKSEEEQKLNEILNSPDYAHSAKCLQAQKWFQANCENWTMWT